ncbi:MAG: hypothetical protein HQ542_10815 [Bacteroidia bacterium]|nr:hypothetical protein [Bacteroidia bacterium]
MMRTVYNPQNLDLLKLLEQHPPDFPHHIDKFAYICGQIERRRSRKKKLIKQEFIPLNAQLLKYYVHNYNEYLAYMIKYEVMETDNLYIAGEKSKGYAFTPQYRTPVKVVPIEEYTLMKKLRIREEKLKKRVQKIKQRYPFVKWFDEGFTIDIEAADALTMNLYKEDLDKNPDEALNKRNYNYINSHRIYNRDFGTPIVDKYGRMHTILTRLNKHFRPLLSYRGKKLASVDVANSQLLIIARLFFQEFYSKDVKNQEAITLYNMSYPYYRDYPFLTKPHRYITTDTTSKDRGMKEQGHSIPREDTTNMFPEYEHSPVNSEFREVFIDIEPEKDKNGTTINSTTNPMFPVSKETPMNSESWGTGVFVETENGYDNNSAKISTNPIFPVYEESPVDRDFRKPGIDTWVANNCDYTSTGTTTNPMLPLYDQSRVNSAFREYINIVCAGKFYNRFGKEISSHTGKQAPDKGKLKDMTFVALYSENYRWTEGKKYIKKLFPEVFQVIQHIKQEDYRLLSWMMQTIESNVMLDRVALRIDREHPDLPIFTIHDCIVTLIGMEEYVEKVIKKEMYKAIGLTPSVKHEPWVPDEQKVNQKGYLLIIPGILKTLNISFQRPVYHKFQNWIPQ